MGTLVRVGGEGIVVYDWAMGTKRRWMQSHIQIFRVGTRLFRCYPA